MGHVLDDEGQHVKEVLELAWSCPGRGDLVVPTSEQGKFEVQGLGIGEACVVRIDGRVGVPAAIEPEAAHVMQNFIADSTRAVANVRIIVKAHNGDSLSGTQTVRFRDQASGQWEPEQGTTTDNGEQVVDYDLVAGRTYEVWINRGPGIPATICPNPGYQEYLVKRNSGTANVKLVGAADGNDRMRFLGETDSYLFTPANDPGRKLVSLPCNKGYTVKAKRVAAPPDPPPDLTECPGPPTQPWTMPCRSGGGSDNLDFAKPW